jgi:hypothetical protein
VILVAGETAQYFAPVLGDGTRVFAFVEDAVEAALAVGLKSRGLAQLERDGEVGQRRSRAIAPLLNAQARALLGPWHSANVPVSKGPPPDADEWREALRDVLGRVSAFPAEAAAEQAAKIARELKWFDKQVARFLENAKRPNHRLSEASKSQIGAFCWLDAELRATVTAARASR